MDIILKYSSETEQKHRIGLFFGLINSKLANQRFILYFVKSLSLLRLSEKNRKKNRKVFCRNGRTICLFFQLINHELSKQLINEIEKIPLKST